MYNPESMRGNLSYVGLEMNRYRNEISEALRSFAGPAFSGLRREIHHKIKFKTVTSLVMLLLMFSLACESRSTAVDLSNADCVAGTTPQTPGSNGAPYDCVSDSSDSQQSIPATTAVRYFPALTDTPTPTDDHVIYQLPHFPSSSDWPRTEAGCKNYVSEGLEWWGDREPSGYGCIFTTGAWRENGNGAQLQDMPIHYEPECQKQGYAWNVPGEVCYSLAVQRGTLLPAETFTPEPLTLP